MARLSMYAAAFVAATLLAIVCATPMSYTPVHGHMYMYTDPMMHAQQPVSTSMFHNPFMTETMPAHTAATAVNPMVDFNDVTKEAMPDFAAVAVSADSVWSLPAHTAATSFEAQMSNAKFETVDMSPPVVSRWTSLANWGGQCHSPATVVSKAGEGLDAFVVGTDGAIWYRAGHTGHLYDWQSLGGSANAGEKPAVANNKDETVSVLIRGSDSFVYFAHYDGSWAPFTKVGTLQTKYPPAVAKWFSRGLFIFATGVDGRMYKVERRHNSWWGGAGSWVAIGSETWSSGPAGVGVLHKNSQDVFCFVYSSNAELHYTRFQVTNAATGLQNRVGGWVATGQHGTLTKSPCTSYRDMGYDIAFRGSNANVVIGTYNLDVGELTFQNLGFNTVGAPAILSNDKGYIFLFALGTDDRIHTCGRSKATNPISNWFVLSNDVWKVDVTANERVGEKIMDIWCVDAYARLRHSSMNYPN